MKKGLSILLIVVIILTAHTVPVQGEEPIKVALDGEILKFDVQPRAINGRVLVPVRAIFEELGLTVDWEQSTKTVIGIKDDFVIKLPLDGIYATKNHLKIKLDVPAMAINGRVLVPIRFISESVGAQVDWLQDTQTVVISTEIDLDNLITSDESHDEMDNSEEERALTTTEIARNVKAVVYIDCLGDYGERSQGSGFIISQDGKIVTNYHVIDGGSDVVITFDDESTYEEEVRVIGYDAEKDIAVLKINMEGLPYVKLGDSDKIELGNDVVAIGSPEGLQNTLSTGIISGLRDDYIQTTAPISHGSSGGALFNRFGKVIGITSAGIMEGENLGFAIPINELKALDMTLSLTLDEVGYFMYNNSTTTVPTGVWAQAISDTQIHVGWDQVDGADYYHVYASDSYYGGYEKLISDAESDAWDWYSDYCVELYNLDPSTIQYFKITAVKDGVESDYSQIVYATTLADAQTSMNYDDYSDYLYSNASVFYIDEDAYTIEFDSIDLEENFNDSDTLFLYYYMDVSNTLDLMNAIEAGYEEEVRDLYFQVISEISEDYPDKEVIGYLIYSEVNLDVDPVYFKENSITPISTVDYDYQTKTWSVWYPFLELDYSGYGSTYDYQWDKLLQ